MSAKRPAALYISYDGMLEPLGQSQVIAYLEGLADEFRFHLISFEKPKDWADADRRGAVGRRLAAAGIAWYPLRYHKRPTLPATLFDIAHGIAHGIWLSLRHRVRLVHARSYISGVIALAVKSLTGARFLFDIRGFWADERTDGGLWPEDGALFRGAKRAERMMLRHADHVVTLTRASLPHLEAMLVAAGRRQAPVSVITTCADLDRFHPAGTSPPTVFTLGYLGSVGTWYLFDELLRIFLSIRQRVPEARLLIVNRLDHDIVRRKLAEHQVPLDAVELVAVDHDDVPAAIRRMTVGSALIRPVFSKLSSAPTKLAEYLGCGVPCLANAGVGDMAAIIQDNCVGVALAAFGTADRERAVDQLLDLVADPGLAERCRETALRHFSLDDGIAAYRVIYRKLLASDAAPSQDFASA